MAGEVDPDRILGAVDRAAGVEVRDDLADRRHRSFDVAAREGDPGEPGDRLGRHGRAAELAKERERRLVARRRLVPLAERRVRVGADAAQDRLQVAVLQLLGEAHRRRRRFDRAGGVAAPERAQRHVAEQVGIGEALADLGAQAAARLEQVERRVVVAEQLLDLAEVVDHAALERAVADRTSDVERLLVVAAADAVAAALRRQDAELPERALSTLRSPTSRAERERFLDVPSRPGVVALELERAPPVDARRQRRGAHPRRLGQGDGARRRRGDARVVADEERESGARCPRRGRERRRHRAARQPARARRRLRPARRAGRCCCRWRGASRAGRSGSPHRRRERARGRGRGSRARPR